MSPILPHPLQLLHVYKNSAATLCPSLDCIYSHVQAYFVNLYNNTLLEPDLPSPGLGFNGSQSIVQSLLYSAVQGKGEYRAEEGEESRGA
jgi:hypothetical protein